MNILVVADPHIPVPPRGYGGTERIAAMCCETLLSLGHRVHLMAAADSRDYGGGLTVHRAPSLALWSRGWRKLLFQLKMARQLPFIELVIYHARHDYLEVGLRTGIPIAIWFHNPVQQSHLDYVTARRAAGVRFIGVSRSQMNGLRPKDRIDIINNCVDTALHTFSATTGCPPYLLFLGRLIRNKGVHTALEVAKRSGMRLIIAGNASTEDGARDYLEREIRPQLVGDCEWVGPYNDRTKIALLRGASALLFPIQWDEPFGLVMAESLACGTPVIALRRGSTPDVVRHGTTGFLCDSVDGMVSAVHRIGEIDRSACRRDAEERFSETYFREQLEGLCEASRRGFPPHV